MSTETEERSGLKIAIVGAGMAGMSMAYRLIEAGYDFEIFEKADEVGGTWRENRYPGLTVDIPTSLYQLFWAPKYDWSRVYAPGSEIQAYLVETADRFNLYPYLRFGMKVERAEFEGGRWQLDFADGTKTAADIVMMGTGFLHVPQRPTMPGVDRFRGLSLHTAEWPEDIDLTGKRVGVIGTGSSGIQVTSELAFRGVAVTQFVRTPQWVETIRNPERSRLTRVLSRVLPSVGRTLMQRAERGIRQDERLQNLEWRLRPGQKREAAIAALREDVEQIRDPRFRSGMTPDYTPGCKRIPKSDRYFEAVQLPNAKVVLSGVAEVTETGVITQEGEVHELDVIVYATGYDTHAYMRPMEIIGRNGATLDQLWTEGAFAHKGISLPGFPNLFMLNGPYAPINSMAPPQTLRWQTSYVMGLVDHIVEHRVELDPTVEATTAFRKKVADAAQHTIWATDCASWYRSTNGELIVWPWGEKEYIDMLEELGIDEEYHREPATSPAILAAKVGVTS